MGANREGAADESPADAGSRMRPHLRARRDRSGRRAAVAEHRLACAPASRAPGRGDHVEVQARRGASRAVAASRPAMRSLARHLEAPVVRSCIPHFGCRDCAFSVERVGEPKLALRAACEGSVAPRGPTPRGINSVPEGGPTWATPRCSLYESRLNSDFLDRLGASSSTASSTWNCGECAEAPSCPPHASHGGSVVKRLFGCTLRLLSVGVVELLVLYRPHPAACRRGTRTGGVLDCRDCCSTGAARRSRCITTQFDCPSSVVCMSLGAFGGGLGVGVGPSIASHRSELSRRQGSRQLDVAWRSRSAKLQP